MHSASSLLAAVMANVAVAASGENRARKFEFFGLSESERIAGYHRKGSYLTCFQYYDVSVELLIHNAAH